MAWTMFYDKHSGGNLKLPPYEAIFIEAPTENAKIVLHNRFNLDWHHVACDCCGPDFVICDDEQPDVVSTLNRVGIQKLVISANQISALDLVMPFTHTL